MKKLALSVWILVGFIGVNFAQLSAEQLLQDIENCLQKDDSNACQAIINNTLQYIKQCDKETCYFIGSIYLKAGYAQEALAYYRQAVSLGDYNTAHFLSKLYAIGGNVSESFLFENIACGKIDEKQNRGLKGEACYNLGTMYDNGNGIEKNHFLAFYYFKKSCDFGIANGCYNVGQLYGTGDGVKQDFSLAKEYIGKSCNLGLQIGCNLYKQLNELGVQ